MKASVWRSNTHLLNVPISDWIGFKGIYKPEYVLGFVFCFFLILMSLDSLGSEGWGRAAAAKLGGVNPSGSSGKMREKGNKT